MNLKQVYGQVYEDLDEPGVYYFYLGNDKGFERITDYAIVQGALDSIQSINLELDNKVEKEDSKVLSSNDYTNEDKVIVVSTPSNFILEKGQRESADNALGQSITQLQGQVGSLQSGFKKTINLSTPAPAAGAYGLYPVSQSGLYVNFGNINVPNTPNTSYVIAYNSDNTFSLLTTTYAINGVEFSQDSDTTILLKHVDKNNTLLYYVKQGNKFGAAGWDESNIPGAAIKDGQIAESKLTTDLTNKINSAGLSGVQSSEGSLIDDDILNFNDKNNNKIAAWTVSGKFYPPQGFKNSIIPQSALDEDLINLILAGGDALKYAKPQLVGKKLVTIGDSITFGMVWQPTLANITGMTYNPTEITDGVGGFAPMGVGGSTIKPIIRNENGCGPGQSIYMRADSVVQYNPDYIILFGGQNDKNRGTLGSINDDPYIGGEIQSTDTPMTFAAAYKGTLLKLINQNPSVPIFAGTLMWNGPSGTPSTTLEGNMASVNNLIRGICNQWSVPLIDWNRLINITPLNYTNFYKTNDTIHPSVAGGRRMAYIAANELY